LMMSLWDALRMNMMISYQELVRTFPNHLFRCAKRHVSLVAPGRVKRGEPRRQPTAKWMRYKMRKPYVTYRYAGLY
ncbi:hypothetical protein BME39_13780, partial [Klebsiella quasipneumoniae subsp. similipneumoniae]